MNSRAQGAIEYLLIIGAAILVVAIVIIAITSVLQQGQNQSSTGQVVHETAYDSLRELNYFKVSGEYYLKDSLIVSALQTSLRFDEGANATNFSSSVPSDANVVCTSCPTYVSSGAFSGAYSFVKENDQYIMVDRKIGYANMPKQETYSIWFNPNSTNTSNVNMIMTFIAIDDAIGYNPGNTGHIRNNIFLNSSGKIRANIGAYGLDCNEAWVTLDSTDSSSYNSWNQIVLTIDYNRLKSRLYLNGVFLVVDEV